MHWYLHKCVGPISHWIECITEYDFHGDWVVSSLLLWVIFSGPRRHDCCFRMWLLERVQYGIVLIECAGEVELSWCISLYPIPLHHRNWYWCGVVVLVSRLQPPPQKYIIHFLIEQYLSISRSVPSLVTLSTWLGPSHYVHYALILWYVLKTIYLL